MPCDVSSSVEANLSIFLHGLKFVVDILAIIWWSRKKVKSVLKPLLLAVLAFQMVYALLAMLHWILELVRSTHFINILVLKTIYIDLFVTHIYLIIGVGLLTCYVLRQERKEVQISASICFKYSVVVIITVSVAIAIFTTSMVIAENSQTVMQMTELQVGNNGSRLEQGQQTMEEEANRYYTPIKVIYSVIYGWFPTVICFLIAVGLIYLYLSLRHKLGKTKQSKVFPPGSEEVDKVTSKDEDGTAISEMGIREIQSLQPEQVLEKRAVNRDSSAFEIAPRIVIIIIVASVISVGTIVLYQERLPNPCTRFVILMLSHVLELLIPAVLIYRKKEAKGKSARNGALMAICKCLKTVVDSAGD